MKDDTEQVKFKRRKKITLMSSVMVMLSYLATQAITLLAKFVGVSSITYGQIGFLLTFSVGITLGFIMVIYVNRSMSNLFVNTVFFSQFGVWLILYTIWVIYLNEARNIALFFAVLALCFLLSNANRAQSLGISITVCILHSIAAYWGIKHMGQPGKLSKELFYVLCFLPSAILISYLAGMFKRQKTDIKKAKRFAEQNLDSLRSMISFIAEECKTLSSASEELLGLSTEMNTSTEKISSKTENAASASDEVSTKTNSLASAINDAADNISLIAESTEEITATIQNISDNSEKAKNISNKAVSQSRFVSEKVKQLGDVAQEIGKITEVISEISEQTNLLALNATIEAARAGESGKGFAVVANEIKELARQTADATQQIKTQITDIQGATSKSVEEIVQNVQIINEIDEIISTITLAIEDQSKNTREIAKNVAQSSQGVSEVKENAVRTSAVAEKIAKTIAEVNRDVAAISGNSEQVNQSALNLLEIARDLKKMADESMQQING